MAEMRFAAIADIHGNDLALEAVLADIAAHGVSDIVNLGDLLSGPLNARLTADLLMDLDLPTIRGNHDRWLAETAPETMGPSDRAAWSELEPHHLDWLSDLPATMVYAGEVFLCHGTPASDTTYWLETVSGPAGATMAGRETIREALGDVGEPLVLCAHTHIPRAVRLPDGPLIVNPGSVGCPGYDDDNPVPHIMQTGTPDASYAILEKDGRGWSVTFRQVPYRSVDMARLARERGRPEWASALETGWIDP